MLIASFDIGKKNFAFCIEDVDCAALAAAHALRSLASPSEFKKKVYASSKLVFFLNSDLTKNCAAGKKFDLTMSANMYALLDQYSDYWKQCSFFVVEEQMGFNAKINLAAIKLGQHCLAYFMIKHPRSHPTGAVVEYSAFHKYQQLGAPKGLTARKRKKWAVDEVTEMLAERGELSYLSNLKSQSKKDDLADTIIQLESFKIRNVSDIERAAIESN